MSVEEFVKEAFPFAVEKRRLFSPEGEETPFFAMFRDDTGEVVSRTMVKSNYQGHTTDDVLAVVEAAGEVFEGGISRAWCAFNYGHYVVCQPSREHRYEVYGDDDAVFPRLVIKAGYGGKAFSVALGMYRDLCKNLAMPSMVQGINRRIIHTSGLRGKMDDLIGTLSIVASGWENLTETIHRMEMNHIHLANFLESLYGPEPERSGRAQTEHRKRTEAIVSRLISERMRSGRPDADERMIVTGWEAYNAVQGYVQHDSSRRGDPDYVRRAIMASNNRFVRRAETLALQVTA